MVKSISFGGGVNSAAMVIGMLDRGERPDYILFADTGCEKPNTYQFLTVFKAWLAERGLKLTTVTNAGRGQGNTLEELCLTRHELPSLAYGFKGCSVKWKRQPMDRWLRDQPDVQAAWERGELVQRCIGIDASETRRRKLPPDNRWTYRYPLVEWGWDREACVVAIEKAGLPSPGKSSCFFCPASKKHEILELARMHPDLAKRAIAIEQNATRMPESAKTKKIYVYEGGQTTNDIRLDDESSDLGSLIEIRNVPVTHEEWLKERSIKGLGRSWSWEQLVREEAPERLPEVFSLPCDCMDGDDEDWPL